MSWIPIGAGLAIGLSALGVAMGQGRVAAAAMDSIGRNPSAAKKIQTPLILTLSFMELIAFLAFIVARSILTPAAA